MESENDLRLSFVHLSPFSVHIPISHFRAIKLREYGFHQSDLVIIVHHFFGISGGVLMHFAPTKTMQWNKTTLTPKKMEVLSEVAMWIRGGLDPPSPLSFVRSL